MATKQDHCHECGADSNVAMQLPPSSMMLINRPLARAQNAPLLAGRQLIRADTRQTALLNQWRSSVESNRRPNEWADGNKANKTVCTTKPYTASNGLSARRNILACTYTSNRFISSHVRALSVASILNATATTCIAHTHKHTHKYIYRSSSCIK